MATGTGRAESRVVVVGGGLAGMAAALAMESAGISVTLIEARRTLGGRAGSFEDPQTGETLDNCQHVLLGCCTNLIDFYQRTDSIKRIRFESRVHFLDRYGRRHDLWGVEGWPAPLHLAPALIGFSILSVAERAAVSRAMMAMLRMGHGGREQLEDEAFGDWLDRYRQPQSLVDKFYDPILISALNEESRRASAAYAIHVFQDAMLRNAGGYRIGLPDCPLSELYARIPLHDARLGTRVAELIFDGARASGVRLQNGDVLEADAVVLATNHHAVQKWIPPELASKDRRFAGLERLESVPILGAHLWFDRPVMELSHAALISGPLQWLFRKDGGGSAVHGVISASRARVDVPREECLRLFEAQIRSLLPAARQAKLVRGVIVIEKRATFSPLPGVDRHRPAQRPPGGGIEGLYLAGDYTRTHWPATMEGAVRSGYLAAEGVVEKVLGRRVGLLVGDLEDGVFWRLLAHCLGREGVAR